jgi:hypothetical protein
MRKKSILLLILLAAWVLPMLANTEAKKDSLFNWSVNATMTSNYIWRGLYCGGPSLQLDATVGYAGFYANMWWNVGATDWTFSTFNPELDLMIGFSRWGLNINYLYCYYFDHYPDGTPSGFFDFRNHPRGGGGTTGEWRISYTHAIPIASGFNGQITGLVAFRTFGRDGYYEDAALQFSGRSSYYGLEDNSPQLKRAYSTYIEVGYDQELGQDWTLAARVGVTPAKSLYTGFKGDFAVTLVGLKLQKVWQYEHMDVSGFAHVMLQPWQVTKDNLILPIEQAGNQKLNLAIGCSVGIGRH